MRLATLFNQIHAQNLPDLSSWQPDYCGELDLVIQRDGSWFHEGREMTRTRLIALFSSVMRKEQDGRYYLVTPVEKLGIQVEDLPLVVVDSEWHGDTLTLHEQWGDTVQLGCDSSLSLIANPEGDLMPAVAVRNGLSARLHRNLYYRLVDQAEVVDTEVGFYSHAQWQCLGRVNSAL